MMEQGARAVPFYNIAIYSFGVNAVYISTAISYAPIGTVETRTPRACEGVCSIPVVSVAHFCFRARLARKRERSDPRVDFYNTPFHITIVNSLNLQFRK